MEWYIKSTEQLKLSTKNTIPTKIIILFKWRIKSSDKNRKFVTTGRALQKMLNTVLKIEMSNSMKAYESINLISEDKYIEIYRLVWHCNGVT